MLASRRFYGDAGPSEHDSWRSGFDGPRRFRIGVGIDVVPTGRAVGNRCKPSVARRRGVVERFGLGKDCRPTHVVRAVGVEERGCMPQLWRTTSGAMTAPATRQLIGEELGTVIGRLEFQPPSIATCCAGRRSRWLRSRET